MAICRYEHACVCTRVEYVNAYVYMYGYVYAHVNGMCTCKCVRCVEERSSKQGGAFVKM